MTTTALETQKGETVSCSFAAKDPWLHLGRICKLDHMACFNFDKPDLIQTCPSLLAHHRGEPVGSTPDLNYPGVAHVVRSGPLGDFVVGMPPEYLRGRGRKEQG